MKFERLAIVLTVINLVMLTFILMRLAPAVAAEDRGGLRGRSLEIVDDQGKVRAQIIVAPPTTMPDGQKYPEMVLFRLIDPNGRPAVKIGTSVNGSAADFSGEAVPSEWSGVQILANGTASSVNLINKDGRKQSITP
jgi:hypothetical protein